MYRKEFQNWLEGISKANKFLKENNYKEFEKQIKINQELSKKVLETKNNG